MIDNYFRQRLPKLLSPITKVFVKLKIPPNTITYSGFLVSLFSAYLITQGNLKSAIIAWWASRLLDSFDGIVARKTKNSTPLGSYLDVSLDMASYSIIIIALSIAFPHFSYLWITVLFLYVLCITTALAYGFNEEKLGIKTKDNRGLRLGAGLAEGGETGIYYTLILLFPFLMKTITILWITILTLTVISRTILAYKNLKPNT